MKLILTQVVEGLGNPGDIVSVKDGFGRNYLIPRRLGVAWTKGGQKQVDQIKRARSARSVRDLDHAKEIANAISSLDVVVKAQVGQTNRLFGSVTTSDIVKAVQDAGGPKLDRRTLTLKHPIKLAGKHRIPVKLHQNVTTAITVNIVNQ
jgi:large subunit ribosomal protein L9